MRPLLITASMVLAVALSCAHSPDSMPSSPPITPVSQVSSASSVSNRAVWAIWEVTISADRSSAEIVPLRLADLHLNTLRFLETNPCLTCLTVEKITIFPKNELEVDIKLSHPYANVLETTAFDVRGIVIFQADYAFPPSGRSIAWGDNLPRLLNYDGYTTLYNPTEYPPDLPGPPALRYIPGKKATGGDLTATLNPFVAYRKDIPRRMFLPGVSETKTFRIRAPQGPIHFGYAVDVSWFAVENVIDPLNDFPSSANCQEATDILTDVGLGLAVEDGGSAPISVRVLDHQLHETVSSVSIYSPLLFDGEASLHLSSGNAEPYVLFTGDIYNNLDAPTGTYPLLIRVRDSIPDPNLGQVDAWQVYPLRIKVQEGWVRIWKHKDPFDLSTTSYVFSIATDSNEDVVVVGDFDGTVDMDPGPDEYIVISENTTSFLSKLAPSGDMKWVVIWGPFAWESSIYAGWVATDNQNNIYVAGTFRGTVDFDPGPGEDIRSAPEGVHYPYISKFDQNGNYLWAQDWGEGSTDENYVGLADITVGSNGIISLTGSFRGSIDFNPGPGQDITTSNGQCDTYLTMYSVNGGYLHTIAFGAESVLDARTSPAGMAIDKSNAVYITGSFEDVVDFDPGPGVDAHTSNGGEDSFLSKFNSTGTFVSAMTWGGTGTYDETDDIAVDKTGNISIIGMFGGDMDFDPGPGEHWISGSGNRYVSRFDKSGNFNWALVFPDPDGGLLLEEITTDCWDNVIIGGRLYDTMDLDPGPGEDLHNSDQWASCLIKLSPSGDFNWARSWSGSGWSIMNDALCVNTDSHGNIYMGGYFSGLIDFDPGEGVENHNAFLSYEGYLIRTTPEGIW